MLSQRSLNSIASEQGRVAVAGHTVPLEQLGLNLQRTMLSLKGQFLAEDGKGVDYRRLHGSPEFQDYCEIAKKLNFVELNGSSETERKPFFINVYNALTIHGLSSSDALPSSVLEVEGFWRNTCYNIGGLVYSLDDIEHGILRCNRPHPGGDVMFKEGDPRLEFKLKELDPRIHFALVCGAKSCPAIQIYSSSKLESGLTMAARNFCQQEVTVKRPENKVVLSKIFLWYFKDFGDNDSELLSWICGYLSEPVLQDLITSGSYSLEYGEYNWLLNRL